MRPEGKICIVIGAASGIGLASAELFAAHGATVVGADVGLAVDGGFAAGKPQDGSLPYDHMMSDHGKR
jgi:NAD(P)-dependent dehydrogenase (short-subunit alcohol dehydrogenase family)